MALRETLRAGSRVCKRTLANLASLFAAQVETIRAALRGDADDPSFELLTKLNATQQRALQLVQGIEL